MNQTILNHHLKFSQFTFPGCYKHHFIKHIPDNIKEITFLIRTNALHRVTLGMNIKDREGIQNKDIKMPWYRYPEDDLFPTVPAMMAELFRRDKRGLYPHRAFNKRIIITCRFVSLLLISILKSKGIPARARPGFASYFKGFNNKSVDHWITQYWHPKEKRWINVDTDGCLENYFDFDPLDVPNDKFDFSAKAWLDLRQGKVKANHFKDAAGFTGLTTIGWQLFHDFHCLMNHEILYQHGPQYAFNRMNKLSAKELKEIDQLAKLMKDPDKNFIKLKKIWETKKKYRILKGGLL